MDITIRNEGDVTLLRMSGELDAVTSPRLTEEFDRLLTDGRRRLVLDLEEVMLIDSSGLSTLVRLLKQIRGQGGRLGLAALQPSVRRVFDLTRLALSFDLYDDVASAVRAAGG
jgi:anti-sigma B factor antagonist